MACLGKSYAEALRCELHGVGWGGAVIDIFGRSANASGLQVGGGGKTRVQEVVDLELGMGWREKRHHECDKAANPT